MADITREQAADLAGVTPDTWSGYVSRGQAPKPKRHIGRTPLWSESEVRRWIERRPGRGSRATPRRRAAARNNTEVVGRDLE